MTGTDIALQLLITALTHATELSALIQNAHAQGRDVSDAEINAERTKFVTARQALLAEIDKQQAA